MNTISVSNIEKKYNIIRGGYDDDENISDIEGGNKQKYIESYNNHIYSVGGLLDLNIKNKIIDLELFANANNIIKDKIINDIFNLPIKVNRNNIDKIVESIFNLEIIDIVRLFIKNNKLKNPLIYCLRDLYTIFSILIHKLLKIYLKNKIFDNKINDKLSSYTFKSFCKLNPINSILLLLKFPLNDLYELLKKNKIINININDVYNYIIIEIKNNKTCKYELDDSIIKNKINLHNAIKNIYNSLNEGTKNDVSYINAYILLYQLLYKYLIKYEKYYIKQSNTISKITKKIFELIKFIE